MIITLLMLWVQAAMAQEPDILAARQISVTKPDGEVVQVETKMAFDECAALAAVKGNYAKVELEEIDEQLTPAEIEMHRDRLKKPIVARRLQHCTAVPLNSN
ncbi:MAG TPA: hypothetical protein PKC28_13665 [Bdellovibrionales bacterium]|nr:hypothetical protein [Bdellovibrionales bacterium]